MIDVQLLSDLRDRSKRYFRDFYPASVEGRPLPEGPKRTDYEQLMGRKLAPMELELVDYAIRFLPDGQLTIGDLVQAMKDGLSEKVEMPDGYAITGTGGKEEWLVQDPPENPTHPGQVGRLIKNPDYDHEPMSDKAWEYVTIGNRLLKELSNQSESMTSISLIHRMLSEGIVPSMLTPALRTSKGEVIPGKQGFVHNDIFQSVFDQQGREAALMLQLSEPERGFIDQQGKFYSRTEAAEALGLNEPLHSERLRELQGL